MVPGAELPLPTAVLRSKIEDASESLTVKHPESRFLLTSIKN